MSQIYFTADTHYGHSNIASKNCSKWGRGYRHYNSLQEMNQNLVDNINKTIKKEDTLYHMGDWSFGGIGNIWEFRKQVNCENIHLILGNHDTHIEENKKIDILAKDLDLAHERIGVMSTQFNADFMFSSVSHYKEIKINGKMFVLAHYAHRVWHGSHRGWYHLYGHSHDTLDCNRETGILNQYGKSMDCGIDSAIRLLGVARPFALTEIIDILDKRSVEFVDHHDSRTNT